MFSMYSSTLARSESERGRGFLLRRVVSMSMSSATDAILLFVISSLLFGGLFSLGGRVMEKREGGSSGDRLDLLPMRGFVYGVGLLRCVGYVETCSKMRVLFAKRNEKR
jgi:hypothetical protein